MPRGRPRKYKISTTLLRTVAQYEVEGLELLAAIQRATGEPLKSDSPEYRLIEQRYLAERDKLKAEFEQSPPQPLVQSIDATVRSDMSLADIDALMRAAGARVRHKQPPEDHKTVSSGPENFPTRPLAAVRAWFAALWQYPDQQAPPGPKNRPPQHVLAAAREAIKAYVRRK